MSLILDALRKSEAERRRGQSPDLFAPVTSASPIARPGLRWLPVAIFVVLVIASAWVVWDGRTQRALDEVAPAGQALADTEAEPTAMPEAEVDAGPGEGADSAATAATPGAPPPAAASTARPTAPPASVAQIDDRPGIASLAPPRAVATPAPASTGTTRVPAALPAPQAPLEPPAPTTAAEAPAEESLPTLAVLDSVTRGTLPPLKLSMHVWGQEPGKRFAIVDGQRVAEGSLLGNGVVEQIRRDGVVINVNGQRLLLPKP